MCSSTVKCGFCKQLVKSTNSTWIKDYGTVHKSCYDVIKGKERKRGFRGRRR